ncbi:HPr family phosphocarrier protein [Nocardia yamanashiensis]|uniref:HPr family phosphocarrier protein n=1 Tax=Nocardia yamanashiensis TaxID=209247 RepID=UPI001E41DA18|nr:HPr family phosphocarrier protein [Nocardia yamanashiensis]UGT43238.1 HPr family phosphocarrier protein [Nocardia yamanashiensis]
MITRTAVVASKTGLHARPAALFAKAAAESPVPVTISVDGKPGVAAGSLLQVMTLGVEQGDTVTLSADDGADAALDKLVELLETDLDG